MAIKGRCLNENIPNYANYGARGITICPEWYGDEGFFAFYKWSMENGWKKGLSIDRVDNDGDYEPSNCRWVGMEVQENNKRTTPKYEYEGRMLTRSQIARENCIDYNRFLREMEITGNDVYLAIKNTIEHMEKRAKKKDKCNK